MTNPYAIDSLGFNPYFMQAYQSPNALAFTSTPQIVQTPQIQQTAVNNPEAAYIPESKENKKNNSNAKLILLGVAATGAALLCRKAYKAGSGAGFFERLSCGFGNMKDSTVNYFKNKKENVLHPDKFKLIQTENNQLLCTIPNKQNIIKTNNVSELANIGESAAVPQITETLANGATKSVKGYNARKASVNINGVDYHISIKDGKIKDVVGKTVDAQGKTKTQSVLSEYLNPSNTNAKDVQKELDKVLKQVNNADFTGLKNIQYSYSENGTTRLFKQADENATATFSSAISNKFNLQTNSSVVNKYRCENPQVNEAIKNYIKDGKSDHLKCIGGEVQSADINGKYHIANGEVVGITSNGKYYAKGSDKYNELYLQYEDFFKAAPKNENLFVNKIYEY